MHRTNDCMELQRVHTHSMGMTHVFMVHQFVLFVAVFVDQRLLRSFSFGYHGSLSLSLYLCSLHTMSQCFNVVRCLQKCLVGIDSLGFDYKLANSYTTFAQMHTHTHTHTRVLAFTFDRMQCYCCYLRFLNPLIIDWSIVWVIFQSIDQAYVAFFRC